ncbi:MAG: ABC transporter ATP-binding protein [Bacteriovoracaceae bacterium]
MYAFKASGINKSYGSKKVLIDFSISLEQGLIHALIGPNGAGKTTFVKSLLNLIAIDSGEITIFDQSWKNEKTHSRIAFIPEKFNFYSYYTPATTVKFLCQMHGVKDDQIKSKLGEALEKFDLSKIKNQKISTISKGQLQRIALSYIYICGPDFIILDEPFSGLDPIGMKELKDFLVDLRQSGKTVFINSHMLSEVEKICDEVTIINEGKAVISGKLSEITQQKNLEEYFYQKIKDNKGK